MKRFMKKSSETGQNNTKQADNPQQATPRNTLFIRSSNVSTPQEPQSSQKEEALESPQKSSEKKQRRFFKGRCSKNTNSETKLHPKEIEPEETLLQNEQLGQQSRVALIDSSVQTDFENDDCEDEEPQTNEAEDCDEEDEVKEEHKESLNRTNPEEEHKENLNKLVVKETESCVRIKKLIIDCPRCEVQISVDNIRTQDAKESRRAVTSGAGSCASSNSTKLPQSSRTNQKVKRNEMQSSRIFICRPQSQCDFCKGSVSSDDETSDECELPSEPTSEESCIVFCENCNSKRVYKPR